MDNSPRARHRRHDTVRRPHLPQSRSHALTAQSTQPPATTSPAPTAAAAAAAAVGRSSFPNQQPNPPPLPTIPKTPRGIPQIRPAPSQIAPSARVSIQFHPPAAPDDPPKPRRRFL
ncbi:vegetative cell wall protein gp1-like [Sorghum bicolor]|uniref:vegetative cell wall protein gp1-like n=1 Tax=Sorghum bicolor TaxID=4558 RepID=UPI000B4263BF|nr:vegetative cell wall protein gp1-like [Sorghum bicolor]|eukprot:XP_021307596.1 vegetative cell wall protein gp1-like [Sorghum bicolor]